jgi:hypothetical protein
MVYVGNVAVGRRGRSDGISMRRVIAIAVAGASLGGCSSFSVSSVSDYFKSTPPTIQVQLESNPPGADAKTSVGPGCKTPCSVSIPAPDGSFSVSYALNKYQPANVAVNVVKNSGDGTTTTDPNPVFAELQPAGPPPKGHHGPKRTKKPKAGAAPADTPFPDPNAPAPGTAAPSR